MNPIQHVVLAQLLSFILFALGGPDGTTRVQNGVRRLQGQEPKSRPTRSDPKLGVPAAVGWAIMFLFLVTLADVPGTSEIGVGFAWLIFVVVALLYGRDAFRNIGRIGSFESMQTPPDNIA